MTEPADFDATEQLLPGLEPPRPGDSALVLATRRSLAALEAAGYLDETHAVLCQLMLDLAEAIDAGRRSGKASAVAMAAAQMLAAYQVMVPESRGGEGDDAWLELVADLRRSAAKARDTT